MIELAKSFLRSTTGHFGIMTALLAVPMIACVGIAVDYTYALERREAYQNAADAAAVGVLSQKSSTMSAALAMSGDGEVALGAEEALKLFNAQLTPAEQALVESVNISVARRSSDIVSNVNFTLNVPTSFLSIINVSKIDVTGNSSAVSPDNHFVDFHILIDNTPSMGVAATEAGIETMEKNTSDTCAFACHTTNTTNNYYTLAKSLGVKMRIDVVRQATQTLTDTAASTRVSDEQFRMAVYTFGTKAETMGLTTVSALSNDLGAVKTLANAVDLMTIPYQGYNNDQTTSFDLALTNIKPMVGNGGKGSSKTDREKVLFLVADGVGDSAKSSGCTKKTTGTRCQEPIDTKFCTPIKAQGVKIAVLYTTYLPLPKNGWYNSWIKPFQTEIATKMKECASDGLYFEVGLGSDLSEAMNALFYKIAGKPRITG
ncbi:pilus assembly protein TadG-related protein [Allorhizobium borbori]|uniref:Putative Flp pilus-assembly TadG-like N-terminal domain-containing protein n=1 Tax=Allorhizobium borbori TaxID=485907 RepID=A0A7W6P250_9HYPH|nr:pilus assembly protein TadG-related protein [Allorhizobium borbori]MBB4103506.1 hypothetical protein [Allorhizobium borbori]